MPPAPDHPLPQLHGGHLDRPGEVPAPPLVWPQQGGDPALLPSPLTRSQLADQFCAEGARAFRRDQPFDVQGRRNLRGGGSLRASLPHTTQEGVHVAQLGIGADWADHLVMTPRSPHPRAGALHICTVTSDVGDDRVHQTAHKRLPISIGGALRLPQGQAFIERGIGNQACRRRCS
jgi:hypothetical protein